MTAHNAKSSHPHVSDALATAQPWVRDHYATLRAEAGPRIEHAKTVVVPVLADTTTKVRDDYIPAAAQATSHLASEAARRSAPYRAELASRSLAALAAARGEVTADDVAKIQRKGRGRKTKIFGITALIGAATGAGVVLWQRSHQKQWDQEDLTDTVLAEPRPDAAAASRPGTADAATPTATPGTPDTAASGDSNGTTASTRAARTGSNSSNNNL